MSHAVRKRWRIRVGAFVGYVFGMAGNALWGAAGIGGYVSWAAGLLCGAAILVIWASGR